MLSMWWSRSRYKDTASSVFLGNCKSMSSIMSSAKRTKRSSQEDGVGYHKDFLQHPNQFHRRQFCNVWCSTLLGGTTDHQVSRQASPHSMALFYSNFSAVTLYVVSLAAVFWDVTRDIPKQTTAKETTLYVTPPELSSWSKTWMTLLLSKCPKAVKSLKKRIHQSALLFLRKAH